MLDGTIQAQTGEAARQAAARLPASLGGGDGGTLPAFRDPAKARAAAEDFEAFFLGQMMQPMFSGLSSEPPFGGGHAESTWRSLLVHEYGKLIARNGGVGIADTVMRTMLSAQEG